jgi:hypothetical protein
VRRLACALVAAGALTMPTPASAHTLPMDRALAKARQYAGDLSIRTWATRNRGFEVTGCRQVNDHTVECSFFISGEPEPPLEGTFRCDDAVQVYYANERSSVLQTRPVGLPSCYLA